MPWSRLSRSVGDGRPPTFNDGNPYNGYIYINPYNWVDDHPLLYGNNGSLDPGTYKRTLRSWSPRLSSTKCPATFLQECVVLPILRSKNFPTYPWNIPQTPNQQFMSGNSCNIWWLFSWMPGVCDPGVCWSSLRSEKQSMTRLLEKNMKPGSRIGGPRKPVMNGVKWGPYKWPKIKWGCLG